MQRNRTVVKVQIAQHAGFCFGVRKAVEIARDTARRAGTLYMLGDIVHNKSVVEELAAEGVVVVNSLDEVENGPVLFRAHGTPKRTWDEAKERGLEIIDATCPLVRKIHEEVRELAEEGRQIYIIGDKGHDEVVGIMSQVDDAIVLSSPAEVKGLRRQRRGGVVVQSTQLITNVRQIVQELMMKVYDLRVINTICQPTRDHQTEIRPLAENNDLVIVVGSHTSANTGRMTDIARGINSRTYQVEGQDDIDPDWFAGIERVGIHAGASTPDHVIQSVLRRIESFSPEYRIIEA